MSQHQGAEGSRRQKSTTRRYEIQQEQKREEALRLAREAEERRQAEIAAEVASSQRPRSFSEELDALLKNWKPDDSLSRMIDEHNRRQAFYGTNFQDMQGEAQMRAVEKFLQVSSSYR